MDETTAIAIDEERAHPESMTWRVVDPKVDEAVRRRIFYTLDDAVRELRAGDHRADRR